MYFTPLSDHTTKARFTDEPPYAHHKVVERKRESGLWLNENTSEAVASIIEQYLNNPTRLRFHWGDVETGQDWGDVYDVSGHIGRTMGPMHAPILVNNSRSMGGGIILAAHVVRIRFAKRSTGGDLYRHPNYTPPAREDHPHDWDKHFA